MCELTIVTETGMFHAACRARLGPSVLWYGFKPRRHLSAIGRGFIDTSDRSAFINHSITFDVDEATLRNAITKVTKKYAEKEYVVLRCDCVSFAADFARECHLQIPTRNFVPYEFLRALAFANRHASMT